MNTIAELLSPAGTSELGRLMMSPAARAKTLASANAINRRRVRLTVTELSHNQADEREATENNLGDGNSASVLIKLSLDPHLNNYGVGSGVVADSMNVVTASSDKCDFHVVALYEYADGLNTESVLLSSMKNVKCGQQVSCVTNCARLSTAVEPYYRLNLLPISLLNMTITLTWEPSVFFINWRSMLVGNVTLVACRKLRWRSTQLYNTSAPYR